MIKFDQKSHTYTNIETGEKYISATTLIGKMKKKFNSDFFAERVARRDGITKEQVLETWDQIAKKATDKGTVIHNLMEDYIKTGKKHKKIYWLFEEYEKVLRRNNIGGDIISSEKLLYSHEYKVAGTADVVIESKNRFSVLDFKTNKAFNFCSKYNEYFNPPVNHLQVCEFNSYGLQLSLYAYLLEHMTKKKVEQLVILYLDQKNKCYRDIHINYMKEEIEKILNFYKINA